MGVHLGWWTVDARDVEAVTRFYEGLTGWARRHEEPAGRGVWLAPVPSSGYGTSLLVYGDHTTGPKTVKNRAHLDLAVRQDALAEVVGRVRDLGGDRTDIGQGDRVAWEVMADVEGNELCLLPSRPRDDPGPVVTVDAVSLDANDVDLVGAFWQELLGWEEVARDEGSVRLRAPDADAWDLLVLASPDPHAVKNRVHPDLLAEGEPGDVARRSVEVERARDLGATRPDIGQGAVPWTVLADPEGNEFCILDPHPAAPARWSTSPVIGSR